MAEAGVEFADVSYALPGAGRLLRDISLKLEPGTTTALLGRSGSGKTTLLRMVNGAGHAHPGGVRGRAAPPATGTCWNCGAASATSSRRPGFSRTWTVERNAGLALELAGTADLEIDERVREVLALAGLDSELARSAIRGSSAAVSGSASGWRARSPPTLRSC